VKELSYLCGSLNTHTNTPRQSPHHHKHTHHPNRYSSSNSNILGTRAIHLERYVRREVREVGCVSSVCAGGGKQRMQHKTHTKHTHRERRYCELVTAIPPTSELLVTARCLLPTLLMARRCTPPPPPPPLLYLPTLATLPRAGRHVSLLFM
jgi:hypothetical protein